MGRFVQINSGHFGSVDSRFVKSAGAIPGSVDYRFIKGASANIFEGSIASPS